MKTYQITYENTEKLDAKLGKLKTELSGMEHSDVLFYMSWMHTTKEKLEEIGKVIEKHFPDSFYYGNEASGNISAGELVYGVSISCTVFEDSGVDAELVWVEEGTEISSLDELWSYCNTKKGLRAVELIPTITYLDKLGIDNSVPAISKDVMIYGGSAVVYEPGIFESGIMAKGHELTHSGMTAVLFSGDNLYGAADYVLGWKGLGRWMKVTKSSDKTIYTIDGEPAFSVYEKYLNMTETDNDNLVFPLIVEEKGVEFIRTPQSVLPDKSMNMYVNIQEGLKTRIAYGDKNTILHTLHERSEKMAEFAPQAIKAYSCGARRLFWGDEGVGVETRMIQKIAPLHGFYSGGEILRFGDKLRVLNSTLILVGFREGEADENARAKKLESEAEDKSIIARLAYFSNQVSQEQAVDFAHEKLRADVSEYLTDNQGDPIELLKVFADRLRKLFNCDQVLYCDFNDTRIMSNSPAAEEVWANPLEYCKQCQHFDIRHPMFRKGVVEMSDTREGYEGVPVHPMCPMKSMLTRIIYCDDKVVGYLSVHYLEHYHVFTDQERRTLAEFSRLLTMALSRYEARKANEEHKKQEEAQRKFRAAGYTSAMDSLSEDYDYAVFLDFENNEGVRLRAIDEFARIIDTADCTLLENVQLDNFLNTLIYPDDREGFINYFMKETLNNPSIKMAKYQCRLMKNGQPEYYLVKRARVKGYDNGFVIGLQNVNHDVILQQQLRSERMGQILLDSFVAVYLINLEDNTYQILKLANTPNVELNITKDNWVKDTKDFSKECTRDTRKAVLELSDINELKKALKESRRKEFLYKHDIPGTKWRRAIVKTFEERNGEPTMAMLTVSKLDHAAVEKEELARQAEAIAEEKTKELREANAALNALSDNVLELMGELVESRDVESGQHIRRVKGFTDILARRIMTDLPEYKLTEEKVRMITHASALHDIGKIAIPDSVLLKPGRLTKDECALMKTHSVKGAEVVEKMSEIWDNEYISLAKEICLFHHEKWDGKGYPYGLKEDEIPISAQIVSIADIYDALTTKRCYKNPYTYEEAYQMILDGKCGAFSDKIMGCFKKCKADFEKYAENPTEITEDKSIMLAETAGYKLPEHLKSSGKVVEVLEKKLEEALRLANTDALTGANNAMAYTMKIAELENRIQSSEEPRFAIVECDINDLKLENDTNGHNSGDQYIKNCCKILGEVFIDSPIFRIGGDEFAIILEGKEYDKRSALMRKISNKVGKAREIATVEEGRASFAAGMAEYSSIRDRSVADVARKADEAMYKNKKNMKK